MAGRTVHARQSSWKTQGGLQRTSVTPCRELRTIKTATAVGCCSIATEGGRGPTRAAENFIAVAPQADAIEFSRDESPLLSH